MTWTTRRTPEEIAFAAGGAFLDSGRDEIPDANTIAEFATVREHEDSLAVVKACIPVAEAAAWVIECRRKSRAKEQSP